MKPNRKIIIYKRYFIDFYEKLPHYIQIKIEWTLNLIQVTDIIPTKYFKHIEGTNGLYEIRVQSGNNIFRIFSFFEKDNIIILGNVFQKKTQKTPKKEITKALKIMEEYFYEKK